MTAPRYVQCSERDIPKGIRFDVPGRNQGQTVEVAYGSFYRGEAGEGDFFKRVTDRSIGPGAVTYYRLVEVTR